MERGCTQIEDVIADVSLAGGRILSNFGPLLDYNLGRLDACGKGEWEFLSISRGILMQNPYFWGIS